MKPRFAWWRSLWLTFEWAASLGYAAGYMYGRARAALCPATFHLGDELTATAKLYGLHRETDGELRMRILDAVHHRKNPRGVLLEQRLRAALERDADHPSLQGVWHNWAMSPNRSPLEDLQEASDQIDASSRVPRPPMPMPDAVKGWVPFSVRDRATTDALRLRSANPESWRRDQLIGEVVWRFEPGMIVWSAGIGAGRGSCFVRARGPAEVYIDGLLSHEDVPGALLTASLGVMRARRLADYVPPKHDGAAEGVG